MNFKLGKRSITFFILIAAFSFGISWWTNSKDDKTIGLVQGIMFLISVTITIGTFTATILLLKSKHRKKYIFLLIVSLIISLNVAYTLYGKDFFRHNPFTTPKYIPEGYSVEYSNPQKGETYLVKGDHSNSIILTKTDKYDWTCNAITKSILTQEVCWGLKEGVAGKQNDEYMKIIWDNNDKTYTILAHDKSLSEQDLTNLITNFP